MEGKDVETYEMKLPKETEGEQILKKSLVMAAVRNWTGYVEYIYL